MYEKENGKHEHSAKRNTEINPPVAARSLGGMWVYHMLAAG
jgi:hypothetical protein